MNIVFWVNGQNIVPYIVIGLCSVLILWWVIDASIHANRDLCQMRAQAEVPDEAAVLADGETEE